MSLSTSNSEISTRLCATDDATPIVDPPAPIVPVAADATADASGDRRRPWRTIGRDAAIMIVIVALAELVLRVVAPEYGRNLYDHTHTGGAKVTFDSEGCRGPDDPNAPALPMAKMPGELRVLCLGDSMTFGTGIAFEDTWPIQLKGQLQAEDSRPVSVINAGLQGVSLSRLTAAYEQKWLQWHPDVVCLLVSGNMISLATIERTDPGMGPPGQMPAYGATPYTPTAMQRLQDSAAAMESRLCLPTWLSINSQRALYFMGVMDNEVANTQWPFGALLSHGWTQGGLDPDMAPKAWGLFADDLTQLNQACRAHGAALIVAMAPARFELSDSWSDNQKDVPLNRLTINPTAKMAEVCRPIGIPAIDLLAALKQGRMRIAQQTGRTPPLYILFDYTHLDRDGNGIVAQEMARRITGVPRAN